MKTDYSIPVTKALISRRRMLGLSAATVTGAILSPELLATAAPRRVVVWSEGTANVDPGSRKVYPNDINAAVAEGLKPLEGWEIITASLKDPDQGVSDERLNTTDVLIWWGHKKHDEVKDDLVKKIEKRVKEEGMGFIALHSSHFAKPYKKLMGTACSWREYQADGTAVKIIVKEPDHPICKGVKDFSLPKIERYGEPFKVPTPEAVPLEGIYTKPDRQTETGRMGLCWTVGKGKVFYLTPGHETYDDFFRPEIRQILRNAVEWAASGRTSKELAMKRTSTKQGTGRGRGSAERRSGKHGLAALLAGFLCVGLGTGAAAASRVVAWGDGSSGKTNVPANLTNAVAIAAGFNHSLALRSDGTVVAWGDGSAGQTSVPSGLTNVVAIAAGNVHSLALKADGRVFQWGPVPPLVNVPGDLTNAVAIAAGELCSMALRADGTVVAWGYSDVGQTNVLRGLANVVAIAGGAISAGSRNPALALKADGTVVGWGAGALPAHGLPTTVPWGLTNVIAIGGGTYQDLAIQKDGTVTAFTGSSTQTPVLSNVVGVASGEYHSLACRADGTVVAWGDNTYGQINIPAGLTNVTMVAAGGYNSLALVGDGPPFLAGPLVDRYSPCGAAVNLAVSATGAQPLSYQWQLSGTNLPGATDLVLSLDTVVPSQTGLYTVILSNVFGAMTSAPARLSLAPVAGWGLYYGAGNIAPSLTNVVAISSGDGVSLMLMGDGTVAQVGYAGGPGHPVGLPQDLTDVVAAAAGGNECLALKADGAVRAWGALPGTNVPANLTNAVAVAAGGYFGLALLSDGTVTAWGDDSQGETNVPSNLTNVVGIAAGYLHSLALKWDGTVVAWGQDSAGATDVPDGLSNVVAVAAGQWQSMALKEDGTVVLWGTLRDPPSGLSGVVAIAAGCKHCLALKADGTVVFWGGACFDAQYTPVPVPYGLTNAVAIAAGYDLSLALWGESLPTASLTSASYEQGVFRGSVSTLRGRGYRLEYTDSLSEPTWRSMPPVPGDGTRKTLTDAAASTSQRFYRVRCQ